MKWRQVFVKKDRKVPANLTKATEKKSLALEDHSEEERMK